MFFEILKKYMIATTVLSAAMCIFERIAEHRYTFKQYIIVFLAYAILPGLLSALGKFICDKIKPSDELISTFDIKWQLLWKWGFPIIGYVLGLMWAVNAIFPRFGII